MEPSADLGTRTQAVDKLHAAQDKATHKDAPKATGTGVFMPLTMRTISNNIASDRCHSRSKPNRRRNLTSPSMLPNCLITTEPARRSNSTTNLATRRKNPVNSRSSLSNLDACLVNQGAADQAPLADVSVAMSAAAGITASAYTTSAFSESTATGSLALLPQEPMNRAFSSPQQPRLALHPSGTPGLDLTDHVLLNITENQQQQMLRQHTAPGQLPMLAGSSGGTSSPRSSATVTSGMPSDGSNAHSMALLNARLDAAAAAAGSLGFGGAISGRGSAPISNEALQIFFGPSAVQPTELGHMVGGSISPVNSRSDLGAAVPQPLSNGGNGSKQPLDVAAAGVMQQPCSSGMAAVSPSAAAATAHAVTASVSNIYPQLSFNKWTGPQPPSGLEGSESFESTGTTDVTASDLDLEQHEQQIQHRIEELLVMKQLLKLKQHHKQQQMQLQLQQLRQEQELQQVLANLQSVKDGSPFEVQRSAASWSAGSAGGTAAIGKTTSQSNQQQQQSLQAQHSSNSLEHFQLEALQQQFQQLQRQEQQAAMPPLSGGLVTHMQQELLPQLQVERSKGSCEKANLELQQLRQLQKELLMKQQQQQFSMQHSAGPFGSTNHTTVVLQPAMSAPAPCSDGMLGFGSAPAPAASGMLNDLTALDSLNGQSFDAVLPMLVDNTSYDSIIGSNMGNNGAACNTRFGVSPGNAHVPLTMLDEGRGNGSNMGHNAAAVGGVQKSVAGWGTANSDLGMKSGDGGMSGFQLF